MTPPRADTSSPDDSLRPNAGAGGVGDDVLDLPVEANPWPLRLIIGVVLIAAAVGIFFAIRSLMTTGERPHEVVHNISLIKQPPPPPPKPPEKMPEPPKVKEEVKIDQPQSKPEDTKAEDNKPPPSGPLGVDAQGGAGGDAFGLAGRSGGRDLVGGGGGGAYYTGLIQRSFYEALQRNRKIQQQPFKLTIRVYLDASGRVAKSEVLDGTGNHELDGLIQTALADLPPLKDVPPPDLREVEVRLSNRT